MATETWGPASWAAISPHQPGVKDDNGKVDLTFLGYWPNALQAVCAVSEFGAKKYTRGGWRTVPQGFMRYTAAMLRHYFGECRGEKVDPETHLLHAAHLAWNAMSRLELLLTEAKDRDRSDV